MGHDWVFDVLKDLRTYALANNLTALAQKVEEALRTAELEIGQPDAQGNLKPPGKGLPH
ncbi:hypothetical protein HOY34_01825 [Xinfangfangia sp. D13-10-4-6]|uniref:hypothetical protein n=1 Tax=Pseudogemmobacter hezensis TaxID=2737662 RepID=UPI0015566EF6|nr:hypothetical protein [Pseudogemmobacter hezensis]NPD13937.1 hypothetical protein [Pseudogemmobacter hezensis]